MNNTYTEEDLRNAVGFKNQSPQGDLLAIRIKEVPDGYEKVSSAEAKAPDGTIVAHSETGHHHVMLDAPGVCVLENPDCAGRFVVSVAPEATGLLVHRRTQHKHAPKLFSPGVYELRRQREFVMQSARRVTD